MIYTIIASEGSYTLKTKRGNDLDWRNPLPEIEFNLYKEVAAYLMENAPPGKHIVSWDGLSGLEQIAVKSLEFKLNNRMINGHPVNGGNGLYRPDGRPVNRALTGYLHTRKK